MKWAEREWVILRLLAYQAAQTKLTPELIRALLMDATGKTTADVDKLLKEGIRS